MHYRRWGISIENLTYFFIPKSSRKYSHTNFYNFAMTHISQDDHLTAGAWYFYWEFDCIFSTERGRKYSHTNSHDFAMALILQDDDLTAGAWATCGLLCLSLSPQGAWRRFACSPAVRFLCGIQERDQVLQRAYWPHYTVIFGMIWSYSIETKPFLNDTGEQISILLLLKPLGHESLSKKSTDNWSTINAIHLCWGDIRNSHFSDEHGCRSKPCKASTERTVHFDFPF